MEMPGIGRTHDAEPDDADPGRGSHAAPTDMVKKSRAMTPPSSFRPTIARPAQPEKYQDFSGLRPKSPAC
jgi:hypothetical protein